MITSMNVSCMALPSVLLSGFVAPAENMPEILQWISKVNPLYYMFIVARGVFMKGYMLRDISSQLAAFASIAAITMGAAYFILRMKQD